MFDDLYDSLYLDQEHGFAEIHARIRGETKRINVFKLLLKISVPELYQAEVEEAGLRLTRDKLIQDAQAVARFLGTLELPTPVEILARRDQLQKMRIELEEQRNSVLEQLRARPEYVHPLRAEVLTLETKLAEKNRDLLFIKQTFQSYLEMENQLEGRFRQSQTHPGIGLPISLVRTQSVPTLLARDYAGDETT